MKKMENMEKIGKIERIQLIVSIINKILIEWSKTNKSIIIHHDQIHQRGKNNNNN